MVSHFHPFFLIPAEHSIFFLKKINVPWRHSTHVKARRQAGRGSSLLMSCGSRGSNSGFLACWQPPLSSEHFNVSHPNYYFSTFQVYANGIRNIDLHYIIRKLAAPVISVLLLSLCVPYVIASGVVPLLGG